MNVGNGLRNFAVYEDGTELCGMADVQLPDIAFATAEVAGAGIAGKINVPFIGQVEAMSLTLSFKTVTDQASNLQEPRDHMIDVRGDQQVRNSSTGEFITQAVKVIMKVIPVKSAVGKFAPSSPTDGSMEFSVSYFALYLDGVQQQEVDPTRYIYKVNGVDYLAAGRKALGK